MFRNGTYRDDILSSAPSTFLIGPEKEEFTLLEAPVERCSDERFNALTGDNECEGKTRCIWIKDVDKDTFARFEEYVYTGDYIAARVITHNPPVQGYSFGYQLTQRGEEATELIINGNKIWTEFREGMPFLNWDKETQRNNSYCEDFTQVFLSHARLSIFSDKYNFSKLRDLCLGKLYNLLVLYTPYQGRIGDVIELIKYTYENTDGENAGNRGLRMIVSHYAACYIEHLVKDAAFGSLLAKYGVIGDDIAGHLNSHRDDGDPDSD